MAPGAVALSSLSPICAANDTRQEHQRDKHINIKLGISLGCYRAPINAAAAAAATFDRNRGSATANGREDALTT